MLSFGRQGGCTHQFTTVVVAHTRTAQYQTRQNSSMEAERPLDALYYWRKGWQLMATEEGKVTLHSGCGCQQVTQAPVGGPVSKYSLSALTGVRGLLIITINYNYSTIILIIFNCYIILIINNNNRKNKIMREKRLWLLGGI